jgi:protein O-GlcNAc transferase
LGFFSINDERMNSQDQRLAIEQLQKGLTQHRAGQISLAQSHYQRAAKLAPANPDVWHLLGVCALQTENVGLAVKHLRTSVKLNPAFADAHNQLGVALRRIGRHAESVGAFRNAMKSRERFVEAAYNLGLAYESNGNPADAERAYAQTLQWRGTHVDAASNLGHLLRQAGRPSEALGYFALAQRVEPQNAQANGNLAMILLDLDRYEEAVPYAHAAAALEPRRAQWWCALGVAERLRKNLDTALHALRRAVELAPADDYAKAELGLVLLEAGDVVTARQLITQLKPGERHSERLRWAVELSLPSIYRDEAEVDAERLRYARGLAAIGAGLRLDTPESRQAAFDAAGGVATFLLHYQDRDNTALQCQFGDLVAEVMTSVAPAFMQPCAWRPLAHGGRLRVGFVSSHLMHHTVSRYYTELLTSLDPAQFDVRVWYSGTKRDFNTEFIASKVAAFAYVNEDASVTAQTIRASELDALVYLETGMDPRHQVLAALRLAPVQGVLYGHPATSGLPNVDYFVSGEALEPVDAERHYRESLVRLPGIGACPKPPPEPGDGRWIDAYVDNAPLLLCLQNHLKLVPAFDATLAQIAKRSGARIGFFMRNALVGSRFRARIEQSFVEHGLDPAKALVFLPAQSHEAYLGAIARSTLVLDSPSFSGGATSLDTLSVGTPVLAWESALARGRQTSGMLRILGLEELIADSEEEYVAKAVALLADRDHLAVLRQCINDRKSRLFEHRPVIEAFEQFLLQACKTAV